MTVTGVSLNGVIGANDYEWKLFGGTMRDGNSWVESYTKKYTYIPLGRNKYVLIQLP